MRVRCRRMVAEGVKTTKSAHQLSSRKGVEMPIAGEIFKTLFEEKDPREAMRDLMTRESKLEDWG